LITLRPTTASAIVPPSTTARPAPWTPEEIETRLVEAVDTLKRLPVPDIQRSVTLWPDVVQDSREAYGYATTRYRPAPAAPDAITRLDETLAWLRWLPRAAQRILWSRANGISWRKIARFVGKAPNTCRAWYLAGLHHITVRLNAASATNAAPRQVPA